MDRCLQKIAFFSILLMMLVLFCLSQFNALAYGRKILSLDKNVLGNDQFRNFAISEQNYEYLMTLADKNSERFSEYAAVLYTEENFSLSEKEAFRYSKRQLEADRKKLTSLKADAYDEMVSALQAVFSDIQCFPAQDYTDETGTYSVSYENGWMDPRSFGGKRSHEGTDLMAEKNERGLYPVVSATDGVVEKIGWLPQGGWRIGIRAPHGAYFYYAHLAEYAKDFAIGEEVKAGTLLGLMGDSGYGEEGTVGQFPVHLHFGIYLTDQEGKEVSINPYYVLEILREF